MNSMCHCATGSLVGKSSLPVDAAMRDLGLPSMQCAAACPMNVVQRKDAFLWVAFVCLDVKHSKPVAATGYVFVRMQILTAECFWLG